MCSKLVPVLAESKLTISFPNHHPLLLFNISYNLSFICNKFPSKTSLLLSHNHPSRKTGRPFPFPFPLQASDTDDHHSSTIKEELEEEEAKMAVSEILQEFGASKEESLDIVSKSPKYVEMLINGVRELDELSLWDSWSSQRGGGGAADQSSLKQISFKDKVYHMAKDKRDRGMLPLLESHGLSLSNATHLARYLSSQTLPELIHKVKYVKEMFFSDTDNEGLIGRNACRMTMHLSIPIDEELQQTLSFFEKIGARRGGLYSLGSKDASFRYLIESFPRLLLLVESHMKQVANFLEDTGVPKECLRNVLLLFPPIIFYDIEKKIKPRLQAFEKVVKQNGFRWKRFMARLPR